MGQGNPIKHTDFAEEGFIKEHAQKELLEFAAQIPVIEEAMKKLAKSMQTTFKGIGKVESLADLIKANQEIEKANKLAIEQEKLDKAKAETQKVLQQIEATKSVQRKTEAQEQKILFDLEAKKAKQKKDEIGAYKELSNQLRQQKKDVKDLLASKKELSDADKELITNTQELDKKLKEIDSTVGDNQRNVGAYKEMLNDARAELGSFGGGIGKLINSLKELHEQNEKATTSTQKLGNGLKLAGATIALIAIMALIKGFELLKESSGQLADTMELTTANLNVFFLNLIQGNLNIKEAEAATGKWIESLQLSRIAIRNISIEITHLSTLLEEQNQIANDVTIGYNERIEAQKKAIELEDEIAQKQLKKAETEFTVITNEINAMRVTLQGKRVNNELLEKEAEAIKKLDEAKAKVSLLELEDSAKTRQLNIERTDQLIDLTLKTKESAHARKTILEEEVKDNTIYIANRRKINKELFDENNAMVAAELKIFKEGRKVEFDFNELLAEQDEVQFVKKMDRIKTLAGHGLDAAGVIELAKIRKQAQEADIANQKIINDLAKEEMKNYERIADIQREISLIKLTDNVHDEAILVKQKAEIYEKSNKSLLEKQNIWDFKLQKLREFQFEEVLSQENESVEAQKKLLEQKEKDAEVKANNTIVDTKVLNAEITKLQKQLDTDLENLRIDAINKEKALIEKKKEDDRKLRNERIDAEFQTLQQINEGIRTGLEKRSEIQQQADQRDIDMHSRMLDVQIKLAAAGKANVLAQEVALTDKAEEKKIQDAKKAAKQQETITVIETFESTLQAALKADKPFVQAFGEALASSGLVTAAFTKLFAGFATGVEGLDGPGTETSDSIPAMLSKGESVATAKGTKENPGLVTAMNQGKVDEYFNSVYLPQYNSSNTPFYGFSNVSHDEKLAQIIDKKFESLQKAIENKPTQSVNLGRLGEWTEKINEGSVNKIVHHLKNNNRPSLRLNG